MAHRTYFLICVLLCCGLITKAQSITYQQADSTSYAQYQAGQWKALVDFGGRTITAGVDFPLLRLRIAYAEFSLGNYSAALSQYQQVLNNDSRNQTARYYSFLCHKYLGQNTGASYQLAYVDTATLHKEQINPFGLLDAGIETSVKVPNNDQRGTGSYTRASLSNRLGWKVQLEQSVAYFSQAITGTYTPTPNAGAPPIAASINSTYTDAQFEYYIKLGYAINSHLTLLGAYHYLNISYGQTGYQNHIGLVGLKYSSPYFTLQGDANFSNISSNNMQQYNGQVTIYPLGNLNLYTTTRASVQSGGARQTIINQTLGFKAAKKLWLEVNAGFGKMDNYLDADALYVYNAIDITKFKAGTTAFFPFGDHAVIYLNYTFEQKQDYYLNTDYNQNSITGGFTWKF